MKKLFAALSLALLTLSAHAQFEKHTSYLNTSLTGLDLSYSNGQKFRLGLDATGGFFFEDAWMVYGRVGFQHQFLPGHDNDVNNLKIGAGARYYFTQNGIFLGCGLQYEHANNIDNDADVMTVKGNFLQLTPEIGYCYYINKYLSIEPSVYYDLCLNKFTKGSRVGLRLGMGFYF